MGSKRPGEGADKVYAAAELWIERALRSDDSLFAPGEPIWSSRWLEELYNRFLNRPDESQASFDAKLHKQLVGSPPEVHQLMAGALYVHFLIVWQGAMGAPKKEDQIRRVLRWGNRQVGFPDHLVAALTPGLAHPGQAFFNFRPFQVGYLIEFARQWKLQTHQNQRRLLDNPWEFKQFLRFEPTSLLFEEYASGDGTIERNARLYSIWYFPMTSKQ